MANYSIKVDNLIKLIIIITVFIYGSLTLNDSEVSLYLSLVLSFALLCKLRQNFIAFRPVFLIGLFIDIGITYYLYHQFGGFSYLLIYISLIDSLIYLDFEAYVFSFICWGFLAYFLRDKSSEYLFLNIFISFLAFVFANQIKKMKINFNRIERLYDMNRNYSYELEEAKKRIENFAKIIENISQLEERNRISRDIHDSIGHKLTGILMQVEACIRYYDIDPSKSKELANSIRDNLRSCSEVLRHTVKGLKPQGYQDGILSIQEMVLNHEKATGMNISFKIGGIRYKLNKTVEMTLYKNIQEALTNSIRHGKASKVNIDLRYTEDNILLIIKDDGVGCGDIKASMGISGMEERTHILGGSIEFSSMNGFVIKVVIPVNVRQVI